MASITRESNGRKIIQFVGSDEKRRSIRLGKLAMRQAEAMRVKIEDLVSASLTGHAPSDETSRWLSGLDDAMIDKLARVGLAQERSSVGLKAFLDSYIEGRTDIKPLTRMNLEQARRRLLIFFDADRPLREIKPTETEEYRLHLNQVGLAGNTARRLIGRARQFFKAAIRRGLIQFNPFDGIAASVKGNPERFHYVSGQDAEKIIAACPRQSVADALCLGPLRWATLPVRGVGSQVGRH